MDIEMTEPAHEQSRARYPDSSGYTKRNGVRLYYEVYGSGEPTIFLLPTWSIIHSRHWKMQIPYLARHCRVVTFDGRGNGRSDRPAAGYQEAEFAAEKHGYTATRHQREAGTGYFDLVTSAISPNAETVALAGSTEAEQFHAA